MGRFLDEEGTIVFAAYIRTWSSRARRHSQARKKRGRSSTEKSKGYTYYIYQIGVFQLSTTIIPARCETKQASDTSNPLKARNS